MVSDLEKPTNKQKAPNVDRIGIKKIIREDKFNVAYNQISDPRKDDFTIGVKTKDLETLPVVCIHHTRTTILPLEKWKLKKGGGDDLGSHANVPQLFVLV